MFHRLPSRLFAVLAVTALAMVASGPPVSARDAEPALRTRIPPAAPPPALARALRGGLATLATEPGATNAGIAETALGARLRSAVETAPDVAVSIQFADGTAPEHRAAVAGIGGRTVNEDAGAIEAYVPRGGLAALAALPGVLRVEPILGRKATWDVPTAALVHGQPNWSRYGYDGSGIRIGIIDEGFGGIGPSEAAHAHWRCYAAIGAFTADPSDCSGATHGAYVAATIAEMAPNVELYLANPMTPEDETATVAWMLSEGVRVINASWTDLFFDGPGNGTSPYSDSYYRLVDHAVAGGALWVNSAGNDALANWVGPWRDANGDGWLDFSSSYRDNPITLHAGEDIAISLRWNDAWGRSANDYDLALFAPTGNAPVAASSDRQDGSGDPIERLDYQAATAGTYYVAVYRRRAAPVSRMQIVAITSDDERLTYSTPTSSLIGPADSANPGMVTVGAVGCAAPAGEPAATDCGIPRSRDAIEVYSARGPTVDGRLKPDLVAEDCTIVGSTPARFCGTSEAAPFVTGAAALLVQADPSLTPQALAATLRTRADALGSGPNDTYGAGRLDLGTPPGRTPMLRLTTVPPATLAVGTWTTFEAEVIYDDGTVVTGGGLGNGLPVTLGVTTNASGATIECDAGGAGTTTRTVAGVARFDRCWVTSPAAGLTLRAFASGLAAVTSAPFDVSGVSADASAATVSLTATRTITWGAASMLTAHLADPAGNALPGQAVAFESSADGKAWTRIGSAKTDASGTAAIAYRPSTNAWFRAVFAGLGDATTQTAPGTVSADARTVVRQTAVLRPDTGATRAVSRGTSVAFATTLRPNRPGLATPVADYRIYGLIGGVWTLYRDVRVAATASGVATLRWTFATSGRWYVRSMATPTSLNANSAWSRIERYAVR